MFKFSFRVWVLLLFQQYHISRGHRPVCSSSLSHAIKCSLQVIVWKRAAVYYSTVIISPLCFVGTFLCFEQRYQIGHYPDCGGQRFPGPLQPDCCLEISDQEVSQQLCRNRITEALKTHFLEDWGLFTNPCLLERRFERDLCVSQYPIGLMYDCRRTFTAVLVIIPDQILRKL